MVATSERTFFKNGKQKGTLSSCSELSFVHTNQIIQIKKSLYIEKTNCANFENLNVQICQMY